jgi:MoaA/NifB/PqqE/SkfB family radical SAM enzyme
MNLKEKSKNSKSFCIMPFTHIVTKTNGEIKLCCRSLPISNVKIERITDAWNNDNLKRIRKQMLEGERPPECNVCFYLEDNNVTSMRQRHNMMKCERGNYLDVLDKVNDDYSISCYNKSIELKLNNLCNLKCRMCHPVDSTMWAKDWPLVSDLQKHNEWTYNNVEKYNLVETPYLCEWENHPSLFEDLNMMKESLDTIWFAGGEPLIDPMHYKILEILKDNGKNISLQYATNLTKIVFQNKSVIDYWGDFKKILIGVSLDGIGDVYNYIRTNGKFEKVFENILEIKKVAKEKNLDIFIYAACTMQAYNIFDLPEIFTFLIDNEIWLNTHRVTYPRFLSSQVLPKKLKDSVSDKINKFLEKTKDRKDLEDDVKKNIIRNTEDNLNFLNGDDLSYLWDDFLEYSRILDEATGSKPLIEIRPEIGEFINGK